MAPSLIACYSALHLRLILAFLYFIMATLLRRGVHQMRHGVRLSSAAVVNIKTEHHGVRHDPATPYSFLDDQARQISPWHNIPLRSTDSDPSIVNFVCEIPRRTRAKYEICTRTKYNPIVQDRNKDGTPRYYAFESLTNYGALPQTYENPDIKDRLTGLAGDGDPLDVCEIGLEKRAETGSVYQVKVLGALAMIDGGETDWKILAVRTDDPLAHQISDVKNAPASIQQLMDNIVTWFRTYKVPEGKPENTFAFDGKFLSRDQALEVIHDTHEQWKAMVKARSALDQTTLFGAEGIAKAMRSGPWVPPYGEKRGITSTHVEHALSLANLRIQ